ncbi:uncharacterized protein [Aegilops tauschii subsp. strangulata]|uniref:uncharacterized protein n=1 Tax=Aegilops tauschii subsp. strangulata TaxID=200361 RepID=UPI001ABD3ED8|nr:uncharacterized protein LOC120975443 [Aegilops tauschii subsp. strangulata]
MEEHEEYQKIIKFKGKQVAEEDPNQNSWRALRTQELGSIKTITDSTAEQMTTSQEMRESYRKLMQQIIAATKFTKWGCRYKHPFVYGVASKHNPITGVNTTTFDRK